jgi:hypothetical protein
LLWQLGFPDRDQSLLRVAVRNDGTVYVAGESACGEFIAAVAEGRELARTAVSSMADDETFTGIALLERRITVTTTYRVLEYEESR